MFSFVFFPLEDCSQAGKTSLTVPLISYGAVKGLIYLELTSDTTGPLRFILDTGTPITTLDTSLSSHLGLGKGNVEITWFGHKQHCQLFTSPNFSLNGVLLKDSRAMIATADLSKLYKKKVATFAGILGTDVLTNYCVQLDFAKNELKFMDPAIEENSGLGTKIPLFIPEDGRVYINDNFLGLPGFPTIVDTGYFGYGWLRQSLYDQWTNSLENPLPSHVQWPDGILAGVKYVSLTLDSPSSEIENGLGIFVLRENVVTFDFARKSLYLKSLRDKYDVTQDRDAQELLRSGMAALEKLKEEKRLPGVVEGQMASNANLTGRAPTQFIAEVPMTNGTCALHYYFFRSNEIDSWRLIRAWKSFNSNRIEILPLPSSTNN